MTDTMYSPIDTPILSNNRLLRFARKGRVFFLPGGVAKSLRVGVVRDTMGGSMAHGCRGELYLDLVRITSFGCFKCFNLFIKLPWWLLNRWTNPDVYVCVCARARIGMRVCVTVYTVHCTGVFTCQCVMSVRWICVMLLRRVICCPIRRCWTRYDRLK